MGWGYEWAPYVSVAQRKRNGVAEATKIIGKGNSLKPIKITGRKMATTFWGAGWCSHIEKMGDYANRLPRGRTYARNGSIVHLEITTGQIFAMVAGSELYQIKIQIDPLPKKTWKQLCGTCAKSVRSVIDLMRGKLPDEVITTLTDPKTGMFPKKSEIGLMCSCPDGAYLCKHLAAVLYGVGNRLDQSPELLFVLRDVKQQDLIGSSLSDNVDTITSGSSSSSFDNDELSDIFGINLALADEGPVVSKQAKRVTRKRSVKKRSTSSKQVSSTKKVAPAKKSATKELARKKSSTAKSVTKSAVPKKDSTKKPANKGGTKKQVATEPVAIKKSASKKQAVKKKSVKKKGLSSKKG
ncbi:MAG: SWIM zinc finger family protein [Planctomycetaceae bacterium]